MDEAENSRAAVLPMRSIVTTRWWIRLLQMFQKPVRNLRVCFGILKRSIPLNQLYVDLNNDEKIENDTEIEEAEMRKTLEQMLSAVPNSILRLEMLERLEHTEPFCLYPDVLHDLKAEEES